MSVIGVQMLLNLEKKNAKDSYASKHDKHGCSLNFNISVKLIFVASNNVCQLNKITDSVCLKLLKSMEH